MSDGSPCFFNRYEVFIDIGNPLLPTKEPVLSLQVADGDWEILTSKEFSNKIVKSSILGVKLVFIDGETHKFLKFIVNMLPMFHKILPIVVYVESCKSLFLSRIVDYVDGVCLNIRLPLKETYSPEDRTLFKRSGEYRTPEKYKESILSMISNIDNKKYSILLIDKEIMSLEDAIETRDYLKRYKSKVILTTRE